MKIRKLVLIGVLLIILCLLGVTIPTAQAQTGGGYDLTWNTLESGGRADAADGSYSLSGSFGQPDASVSLNGGGYALVGGFWSGVSTCSLKLPLILK